MRCVGKRGEAGSRLWDGRFPQGHLNSFSVPRLSLAWLCNLLSKSGAAGIAGLHGENEAQRSAVDADDVVRADPAVKRGD